MFATFTAMTIIKKAIKSSLSKFDLIHLQTNVWVRETVWIFFLCKKYFFVNNLRLLLLSMEHVEHSLSTWIICSDLENFLFYFFLLLVGRKKLFEIFHLFLDFILLFHVMYICIKTLFYFSLFLIKKSIS